jgi:hypothetical protein
MGKQTVTPLEKALERKIEACYLQERGTVFHISKDILNLAHFRIMAR